MRGDVGWVDGERGGGDGGDGERGVGDEAWRAFVRSPARAGRDKNTRGTSFSFVCHSSQQERPGMSFLGTVQRFTQQWLQAEQGLDLRDDDPELVPHKAQYRLGACST